MNNIVNYTEVRQANRSLEYSLKTRFHLSYNVYYVNYKTGW